MPGVQLAPVGQGKAPEEKAPEDWRTPKPGGMSRGPRESLILLLPVGSSTFMPQTLRIGFMLFSDPAHRLQKLPDADAAAENRSKIGPKPVRYARRLGVHGAVWPVIRWLVCFGRSVCCQACHLRPGPGESARGLAHSTTWRNVARSARIAHSASARWFLDFHASDIANRVHVIV